jgi:hypothetical protein
MIQLDHHNTTIDRAVHKYGQIILGKDPNPNDPFKYTQVHPKPLTFVPTFTKIE